MDVPLPSKINTITFFLTSALPQQYGAALSFSLFPFTAVEFIGAVGNEWPTDTFHTGWSLNPEVNQKEVIKLIVSFEELVNLKSLIENKQSTDMRQLYG